MKRRGERGTWITLIALFKFVKAAGLIAAAVGAFRLLDPGRAERAREWIISLALAWYPHGASAVAHTVNRMDSGRFELLAIVALGYAALFLVEGVGLWLARRWAEYFTIIVTSSLLPLELWELNHRTTVPRVAALVINVAVVVYLVVHVRAEGRRKA